jgi:hypothetical protein
MEKSLFLFLPSKQNVILITMFHILLLSSIYTGVDYHNFTTVDEKFDGIYPRDIYQTGNSFYWTSMKHINNIRNYSQSYDINIDENKINLYIYNNKETLVYEILTIAQTTIEINGERNETFLQNKVISVQSNKVLILIRESVISRPSTFPYKTNVSSSSYILGLDLTTNSVYNSKIIFNGFNSSQYIFQGQNFYALMSNESGYWAYKSPTLKNLIFESVFNPNNIISQRNVQLISGNPLFSDTNIIDISTDLLYQNGFVMKINPSGLTINTQPTLILNKVDSNENFHFGISSIYLDIGEGYTGVNAPNYGISSFKQNLTVFWDLGPGNINSEQLLILETKGDEIIIIQKSSPSNNYYDNKSFWFNSSDFNDELYLNWSRSKQISILKFNPLYYNLSNFVQFNPELSETIHSTVVFPRVNSAIELPILYNSEQLDVKFTANYNLRKENLELYITLFDTLSGPKNSILNIDDEGNIYNSSAGYSGSSIFMLEIDLETHKIVQIEKIIGLDKPFDDFYHDKFSGWSVLGIIGVYSYWYNDKQHTIYFFFGYFISSIPPLKNVYSQTNSLCIIDRSNGSL